MEKRLMRGKVVLSTRTTTAPAFRSHHVTVTPEGRNVFVRLPFASFASMRPTAIVVEQGGRTERIRIRDVTRLLQLSAVGLGVFLVLTARSYTQRRKEFQL